MTEEMAISNKHSNGKLDMLWHNGMELIVHERPLLVSWANALSEYSWSYALMEPIPKKLKAVLQETEDKLSLKKLSEASDGIKKLLSFFSKGEYKIIKFELEAKQIGTYQRLANYSIEMSHQIEKEREVDYKEMFNTGVTEESRVQTILNWSTSGFTSLQSPIIGLENKDQIDNGLVRKYEAQIKAGNCPYCLIVSITSENEDSFRAYCIGTLEKLIAYQNLAWPPRFIEVKKIDNASQKFHEDLLVQLKQRLFTWQMKSILEQYFNDDMELENK